MKEGWEIKKLGEVCQIINGGTPKSNIKEYWDGNINWITPADLGKLKSVLAGETPRKLTSLGLLKSSAKLFPVNSVILSTRAPIGHLAINTTPMSTNQGCRGIVPNDNLDTWYLYYFLKGNIELLNELGTGTTFLELSTKSLSSVSIPLPPLSEQQRIVALLDRAFAAIEQAKANYERCLRLSKEVFESYLQGVFERGDWEWKTLDEIAENLDSKRIPITKSKRTAGKIPYYGASGVVDFVADYIFDEDLLCISEDGANLLARTYPIAFSISGKTWVNNHAHVLRFATITTQKFIEFYINSIKIDDYVSGMAQPKLNQKNLNAIPVPFPDIEVQKDLLNKVTTLRAETQKLEHLYQRKLDNLEELKKSVLQKAFRGQLSELGLEGLKDERISELQSDGING
jgi:type I restriction enzyme S subunit